MGPLTPRAIIALIVATVYAKFHLLLLDVAPKILPITVISLEAFNIKIP
ncbi:hypothetical protein FH149_06685 [Staphylococcus lugdunensis]|nr:hypothetical protein [Staphylococcus lugdunensis]